MEILCGRGWGKYAEWRELGFLRSGCCLRDFISEQNLIDHF